MPNAKITINNTTIDVCRSYAAYFSTSTFPYTRLFCKFSVDRFAHELHLTIRPINNSNTKLIHCKKRGVYHSRHNVYFGRICWNINALLKNVDYGEIEYCIQINKTKKYLLMFLGGCCKGWGGLVDHESRFLRCAK